MNRLAAIFLSHLILWALLGGLNHSLAQWQLQVSVLGLFVAFPALRMGRTEGLLCALLAGLIIDAPTPLPLGTSSLLLGIAHLVLMKLRPRIPFSETVMQMIVAVLSGALLHLVRGAVAAHLIPGVSFLWIRTFWELATSTVFAALAAPWFFALQERLVQLLRLSRERRLADSGDED